MIGEVDHQWLDEATTKSRLVTKPYPTLVFIRQMEICCMVH